MENELRVIYKSINFLEHPLWTPSRKMMAKQCYTDSSGFAIETYHGIPGAFDIDVLNYLLYQQQTNDTHELQFKSLYNIYRDMGYKHTDWYHEAVKNSIIKWNGVIIIIPKNTFYPHNHKYTRFGIINKSNVDRKDDDIVNIELDTEFIKRNEQNSVKSYKRYLPIEFIKDLSPFSKRVYEILIKNFYNRKEWEIGIDKFLDKMMVGDTLKYTSHVVNYLNRSIDEIEKKLNKFNYHNDKFLKFRIQMDKDKLDRRILSFRKNIKTF
jgi:DNA-directed RNA polymerase beta' subunit